MKRTTKSIKFKCKSHGIVTLYYELNQLNGAWMYWTDIDSAMYATDKREINRMLRHIKKTHTVI